MIITSFSEKGYGEYGKRFIEGFLDKWEDEELTVYVEGKETVEAIKKQCGHERIYWFDLLQDPDFVKFGALLHQSDPMFRGKMRDPNSGREMYNFRYDANKFYRKVYAVTAYAQTESLSSAPPAAPSAPFAWADADIVFNRKLPANFLIDLLSGHGLAYLGRPHMYTETGFVVWNPTYKDHDLFMRLYRDTFLNGSFRLLTEWHDCQVFDFVRETLGYDGRNIAKGCDPNHPFVYSILGTYMDHLKGPERKEQGKSKEAQKDVA